MLKFNSKTAEYTVFSEILVHIEIIARAEITAHVLKISVLTVMNLSYNRFWIRLQYVKYVSNESALHLSFFYTSRNRQMNLLFTIITKPRNKFFSPAEVEIILAHAEILAQGSERLKWYNHSAVDSENTVILFFHFLRWIATEF